MGKTILKIDDEVYDFILIGIVSTFRDFRICRDINSALELMIQKSLFYLLLFLALAVGTFVLNLIQGKNYFFFRYIEVSFVKLS